MVWEAPRGREKFPEVAVDESYFYVLLLLLCTNNVYGFRSLERILEGYCFPHFGRISLLSLPIPTFRPHFFRTPCLQVEFACVGLNTPGGRSAPG